MRSLSKYTVAEYVHFFQQGDERGLDFFFHEFFPTITLYANHFVQNKEIANDIASGAFVKTWKQHFKLDSYNAIRAYLYKIAYRESIREVKKEIRRRNIYKKATPSTVTNETAIDNLIRSEVYRILHAAMKELPKGSGRVVKMYYIDGKKIQEIAKELNLAESTIKNQKAQGLKALQKKLLKPLSRMILLVLQIFF